MNTAETIAAPSTWIPARNAVACELEGEIVLLDLQSGTYFGLNAVGAEIWNQLVLGKSVAEVQLHLLSIYAVTRQQCEVELLALIGQLRERHLVTERR